MAFDPKSRYFGSRGKSPPATDESIGRNISVIQHNRHIEKEKRHPHQRLVDMLAEKAGSAISVGLHLIFYGGWIVYSVRSDPSGTDIFGHLGIVASLESIFITVLILSYQRRNSIREQRHSDLHLQMSLLAEQEITRLARVTEAIALHLNVQSPALQDLKPVTKDVDPVNILDELERQEADND